MKPTAQVSISIAALFAFFATACPETIPPSQSNDAGGDDASASAHWSAVVEHVDGTFLSTWGSSPTDVYAVGGPRGNGFKTLVMHYDGAAWTRIDVVGTETFWWVYGTSATDIWMAGENGRIARWDGTKLTETPTGTTATVFGVWAASPTDAWAVGGTPGVATAPQDVLLHWDGNAWAPSPLPKTLGRTYFKVWGTSSENLYVVGEAGTIWHRVGTTWNDEGDPPLAHGTLLTVFGCSANEVYAVGGRDVLRSDGAKWGAVTDVTLTNDVNGVTCNAPGDVAIVGSGGSKQRLVAGAWQDDFGTQPFSDLHGVWADGTGVYWAVGGNFVANSQPGVSREGVIARYGK